LFRNCLYTNLCFHTTNKRATFCAYYSKGLAEPPDENYPFILTTDRLYGHWHTQTRTDRIEKIRKLHPQPFIEVHPRDAATLGIIDNQCLEMRSQRSPKASRRGKTKFPFSLDNGKLLTIFINEEFTI
jgi:ferredoxin-nitrate reductase